LAVSTVEEDPVREHRVHLNLSRFDATCSA
jgi:hypothetical protein